MATKSFSAGGGTFGDKPGVSAMKKYPKTMTASQMKPGKMYQGYTAPKSKASAKGDQPSMATWRPSPGGFNYPKK